MLKRPSLLASAPKINPGTLARFIAKVDQRGECWVWTASKYPLGYGQFSAEGWTVGAHRFAWMAFRGAIPPGLHVLHNCPGGDDPACVNPGHLWLGTQAENIADMCAKGRQASGDRNGSRTHPQSVARGRRHGSRTHPERVPRGDRHGSRTHPEAQVRGEMVGGVRLNAVAVRVIRLLASRGVPRWKLAAAYGVCTGTVDRIVLRRTWKHVEPICRACVEASVDRHVAEYPSTHSLPRLAARA